VHTEATASGAREGEGGKGGGGEARMGGASAGGRRDPDTTATPA
jgi:hypothetical protein